MATKIVTTTEGPLSEQGEQQRARQAVLWAKDATVDAYVARTPPEVTECRERGRHMFPSIRQIGLVFGQITQGGYHVRKVGCEVCRYPQGHEYEGQYRVVRTEWWDLRVRKGVVVRCELDRAWTRYVDPEYLGHKGEGRMKPKQIRNSLGTSAMSGVRMVELRKEIMASLRANADIAPQEERETG